MLLDECTEIGLHEPQVVGDGVAFLASPEDVARANLQLSLATRVLLRVERFRCLRLAELHRKAGNLDWAKWLDLKRPQAVRARCIKSKLYHSGAVVERVAEAIRAAGGTIDEEADATVDVLIERDSARIAIDSSGAPLHQRGWRLASAKAPLREDLAAAAVRVAAPRPGELVADPCAGAGTLVLEAAQSALGLAPGRLRSFAFETAPWFVGAAAEGAGVSSEMSSEPQPGDGPQWLGSDRDAGAIEAARSNAERTQLPEGVLHWECAALRSAGLWSRIREADAPAVVLCNPPYGKRVGSKNELRNLYAALGQEITSLPSGSRAVIVSAETELAQATRLSGLERVLKLSHGGLWVGVYRAIID